MSSITERVAKLEETVQQLVARVASPDPMIQMIVSKTQGIEQSVTSLGKTFAAVTEELTESGTLDGSAVMSRLRDYEDKSSMTNVKNLLNDNIIESSDIVSPHSLVVIEHKISNTKTSESITVSNYNLVGLGSPATNPAWKEGLIGKTAKEIFTFMVSPDTSEIITIKEIYSIVERSVDGEVTETSLDQSGT